MQASKHTFMHAFTQINDCTMPVKEMKSVKRLRLTLITVYTFIAIETRTVVAWIQTDASALNTWRGYTVIIHCGTKDIQSSYTVEQREQNSKQIHSYKVSFGSFNSLFIAIANFTIDTRLTIHVYST